MIYKTIIFLSIFFGSAQIDKPYHKSLNDSIVKYLELDSNKALDFGFEVLKTANIVNPNRELVSTYNLIGQLLTNKNLYAEALSCATSIPRLNLPSGDKVTTVTIKFVEFGKV